MTNQLRITILALCVIVMLYYYAFDMSSQYSDVKQLELRNNPYQYVYDIYRSNTALDARFVSNDTGYIPLTYNMKQNMMWNHRSVCTNKTFVLLMYYTCRQELDTRNLIRHYVKQGMIIDGMTVNYVMIVAAGANETDALNELKKENEEFNDLLVSLHEDNYRNWPITVLDAYMWVRDYCLQASYTVKVDGDTWVHLGNLIHFLHDAPRDKFYGGRLCSEFYRGGQKYKGIVKIHPNDYPGKKIVFNFGCCNALSRDVIPFVNIGAQFMDYIWPAAEDSLIAEILRKGGIHPFRNLKDYHWMLFHSHVNGTSIPENTISVHTYKDDQRLISLYKAHCTGDCGNASRSYSR